MALGSGALGFGAFAAESAWPLALVAWAPLLVAIRGVPRSKAFWLGWLSGATMSAAGFSFLVTALVRRGGLPLGGALGLFIGLAAYQGLRGAVFAILSRWLEQRDAPRAACVGAFVLSELVLPLPFPFHSGAALVACPWLAQIADVGGPLALSALAVATSLGAAELVEGLRAPRRVVTTRIALLGCPIVAAAYGAARIADVERRIDGAPMATIGVVRQPSAEVGPSAAEFVRASRALVERGADLVVWAEGALPGALPEGDLSELLASTFSRTLGAPTLVTGSVIDRDGRARNAVLALDERGTLVGRYDKHHLAPFGEFIPLEERAPWLGSLSPRAGHFTAGVDRAPMELGGHRIATTICLEDLFHRHVSSLLAEGSPTLLVNAGSDAWFPASDEPRLHLLLSRGRAVEHHVFEVRATSAGTAAVVDPLGRVVSRLKDDEPSGLARVRWVHVPTIYERVGDWPAWAAAVLTLLLAAASRPRKETESSGSRARPSARRERSAAANVEPIARASEPS